jgi:hypothetical protein
MVEEMIEVVRGSAVVEPTTSKGVPTAATEGARVGETHFRMIQPDKTLAQRLEDAYRDDALTPEEKGLLDDAAKQFGSRLSDEE